LFALAISLTRAAAQTPDKPVSYLTDTAKVVGRDEARIIERRCTDLDRSRRAQVAIVVIRSREGEPIDVVALRLFNKLGIGRKGVNDGILIMPAIQDRRSRLSVGYGLEKVVTNEAAADILRQMRPSLRAGQYGAALNLALDLLSAKLPPATGRN
jgi:uncharacterized protein